MDCREAARFVQLRLDEEIEPLDCVQLDSHLESCTHCRRYVEGEVRFQHGVRARLIDATERTRAPEHLREGILAGLEVEEARTRFPVGRAAAACIAVFMVGALSWSSSQPHAQILDETVSRHSRYLPPEVRADVLSEEGVNRFLRDNLRYPVAAPRFAGAKVPVRLIGARLSSIRDSDVAYMMYDHRGARLSVFAFPRGSQAFDPQGLERQQHGNRVVYVGSRRGYNVVSWEDREVSYSMVSDVDPREMVQLVSTTSSR